MVNYVNFRSLPAQLFLFCLFGLFSPFPSGHANPNPGKTRNIIHCLGEEEAMIHRFKLNGPLYSLNQKLIILMVVNSDLAVKPHFVEAICTDKEFSPSVNLLRHFMENKGEIFVTEEGDPAGRVQKAQLVEVFLTEIPTLFFQYLADLSALLPTAHCLNENVTGLRKLLFEYRYVEPFAEWNHQLLSKEKLEKIFQKIKNFDKLIKKCQKKVLLKKKS